MYLRYVCAVDHPYADGELGIFQATPLLRFEDQPRWLIAVFRDAYRRCAELPAPPCLSSQATADGRHGVCWLRARARPWVTRFRDMAWVMDEMGLPVAEIATKDPGRIVYRDACQVVALPGARVRRAFPRRPRPGVCVVRPAT